MRGFEQTPHKRQPWQDNINTAPPIRPEGASGILISATPVRQIDLREIPLFGTLPCPCGLMAVLCSAAAILLHFLPDYIGYFSRQPTMAAPVIVP